MKIAAVIPSRFQSSRFPGKPLAQIAGKTMIERVYRQVEKVGCFSEIIVATDDKRILTEVIAFGGKAEMTDSAINSGTERVWSVLKKKDCDAVINIQGDEPLISGKLILQIYEALKIPSILKFSLNLISPMISVSRSINPLIFRAGSILFIFFLLGQNGKQALKFSKRIKKNLNFSISRFCIS